MNSIRPPAIAGTFYPAATEGLAQLVENLLDGGPSPQGVCPKALIVPHAGLVYSGPTAALGFRELSPCAEEIQRVVLIGPAHRVPLSGLAYPHWDRFATPLGTVSVDQAAISALTRLPQVHGNDEAHRWEHSLEIQLPFLQRVLANFKIVPLLVGRTNAEAVAEVIEFLWGGPETVIVVSSDLSHFHTYENASRIDHRTAEKILERSATLNHEQACGCQGINGLLTVARRHGLDIKLRDLCNSGDTAGSKDRVVGYATFLLSETRPQ